MTGRRTANRDTSWSRGDDAGVTLTEVIVAMSILSVVLALTTAGLVQMFRITSATETQAIAQSQIGRAVVRLDRQIRYASGISEPHLSGHGVQQVEYLVVETGKSTCVQLRVSDNRRA